MSIVYDVNAISILCQKLSQNYVQNWVKIAKKWVNLHISVPHFPALNFAETLEGP